MERIDGLLADEVGTRQLQLGRSGVRRRDRLGGVRNYAARLHLRAMKPGDEALFYHSGDQRAVVGVMRIAGPGGPDGDDGAWVKVPVEPLRPLPRPVTLAEIKAEPALAKMELLRQSRLSVAPVRAEEWDRILAMAN